MHVDIYIKIEYNKCTTIYQLGATKGETTMRKMKRFTALSMAVIMAAGICLAGCGGDSGKAGKSEDKKQASTEEGSGDEGAAKKDGKITVFQSKTEIMGDLTALAEAYTEETGVKVEVWETTGDSYYSDLKTNMTTGAGPTLFIWQK